MHRKFLCALSIVLLACGADTGSSVDDGAWGEVEGFDERAESANDDGAAEERVDALGTVEQSQVGTDTPFLQGCFDSGSECLSFTVTQQLQFGKNCICVIVDPGCPLEASIGVRCDF